MLVLHGISRTRNMYNQNPEHKAMSPRISFSNGFVESSRSRDHSHPTNSRAAAAPVSSSDFEFSKSNHSMISADELFCKGRLLPLKEKTTTLRDELQNENEDEERRPPKNPARWRGFLGLRKSHIASKKKTTADDTNINSHSQEYVD